MTASWGSNHSLPSAWMAMHLDGDLAAVVELGAVAGGDASGSEIDVGQVAAESNVQVPAEPGIDVVAADGTEYRPLDPARQGPKRWMACDLRS